MENFEAKKFELSEEQKYILQFCVERMKFYVDAMQEDLISREDFMIVHKRTTDFVGGLKKKGLDVDTIYLFHILVGSGIDGGIVAFDTSDNDIEKFIRIDMLDGIHIKAD